MSFYTALVKTEEGKISSEKAKVSLFLKKMEPNPFLLEE